MKQLYYDSERYEEQDCDPWKKREHKVCDVFLAGGTFKLWYSEGQLGQSTAFSLS